MCWYSWQLIQYCSIVMVDFHRQLLSTSTHTHTHTSIIVPYRPFNWAESNLCVCHNSQQLKSRKAECPERKNVEKRTQNQFRLVCSYAMSACYSMFLLCSVLLRWWLDFERFKGHCGDRLDSRLNSISFLSTSLRYASIGCVDRLYDMEKINRKRIKWREQKQTKYDAIQFRMRVIKCVSAVCVCTEYDDCIIVIDSDLAIRHSLATMTYVVRIHTIRWNTRLILHQAKFASVSFRT